MKLKLFNFDLGKLKPNLSFFKKKTKKQNKSKTSFDFNKLPLVIKIKSDLNSSLSKITDKLGFDWKSKLGVEKLPPQVVEALEKKEVISGIWGLIILILAWKLLYIPYVDFSLKMENLAKERKNTLLLTKKQSELRKKYSDALVKSEKDQEVYKELKVKFDEGKFEDEIELDEYIIYLMKKNKISVKSIGQVQLSSEPLESATPTLKKVDDKNKKVVNKAPTPPPSKPEETKIQPAGVSAEETVTKAHYTYEVVGYFQKIEDLFVAIEKSSMMMTLRDSPITINSKTNDIVDVVFSIKGYLKDDKIGKVEGSLSLEENDFRVKKTLFDQVGKEILRSKIIGITITEVAGELYGVIHQVDGKRDVIKNGKVIELQKRKYETTIELVDENYVVKIKDIETREMLDFTVAKDSEATKKIQGSEKGANK